MSVSAVAPTPFYQDPDRLPIGLPQARAEEAEPASGDGRRLSMFAEGDEAPSFWDVLDIVNPLQHIPVVNDLYREITGDKIGVGARLVGGTLFGGAIGLAAAAANAVIEESTGKDVGAHVLAMFKDDAPAADAPATALAAAPAPPVPAAPAPAKAAPADAAPVIALPEFAPAKTAAGPTMAFSLDAAPPVAAAPPVPVAQAPLAAAQAEAGAPPVPLGAKPVRLMPAPGRNPNANPNPLPPIAVPVSNSSTRSNVPITGRSPALAPSPAAVQRALAGQDVPANHPMLPPESEAGAQTAANPDWFTAAWGQALDKYQRTNQMTGKAAPTTSTLQ